MQFSSTLAAIAAFSSAASATRITNYFGEITVQDIHGKNTNLGIDDHVDVDDGWAFIWSGPQDCRGHVFSWPSYYGDVKMWGASTMYDASNNIIEQVSCSS
ncbi:hypothetical protein NQ176_g515 [Zarea fungicola]|uniref:Uncharacterized protein n=1 Tax=Zarea fungicola TaxID=93591 RepID=A0ACC1NXS1_9HYPO|nr:hypothetical protein NQ176_g515 [Lecanicillium fungicola]